MSSSLSIEYFAEGSADAPLVLIYGYDIPSARELFHAIRSLRDGREDSISVHTLPGYSGIQNLELIFQLKEKDEGVVLFGNLQFACGLTSDGWDNVEARLAPFCDRYASPGSFQWLDTSSKISLLFSTDRGW